MTRNLRDPASGQIYPAGAIANKEAYEPVVIVGHVTWLELTERTRALEHAAGEMGVRWTGDSLVDLIERVGKDNE